MSIDHEVGFGAARVRLASMLCVLCLAVSAAAQPGLCPPRELFGAAVGDRLGSALAPLGDLDGDGIGDFAVGAPFARGAGGLAVGEVRAVSGSTLAPFWVQRGGTAFAQFGAALALLEDIDGDGAKEIAIGAWNDAGAGRVSVHSGRTGLTLWTQSGAIGDRFGYAIARVGDADQDGVQDILVGSPGFDRDRGRARILSGRIGTVLHTFDGANAGEGYGTAVARLGLIDADSIAEIAIGAPFAGSALGASTGRVEVRRGGDGTVLWSRGGELAGQQFGSALVAHPDRTNDGRPELLIGAPSDDRNGTDSGAAFIHSGTDGEPIQGLFGTQPFEQWGACVGSAGTRRHAQLEDVVIAAPGFDPGIGPNTGRILIIRAEDSVLLTQITGTVPGARFGEALGEPTAISDDPRDDLLIGAPRHSDGLLGPDRGFAGVFHAPWWGLRGTGTNGNPMNVRLGALPRFGQTVPVTVDGGVTGQEVWIGFAAVEEASTIQQGSLQTQILLPIDLLRTRIVGPFTFNAAGVAETTIAFLAEPFLDGCRLLGQSISTDSQGRLISSSLLVMTPGR